jgi:hypothetical protein
MEQVADPAGGNHSDPVGLQPPPGDAGAVDGDDGGDLDLGDAQDLVSQVRLPPNPAERGDQ